MTRLLDAQGRAVPLGAEIARGGEGVVYDMPGQPGSVAKIYLARPDRDKADKLAAMVAMATARLIALSAWPTATLHAPGGAVAGFAMPKLVGHRPVFQVYGPKLRLKQFPRADWRFLVHAAGNVARAFAVMHDAGLVIGDVNHGNLLVAGDATVRFIDADSMQVTQGGRHWPCEVGVGTHQPPEMQGLASYRDVVRTPNHDDFGLAVLIFQLLCVGRHPFAGRYAGPGEPPDIEQAITASRYAYSADTRRTQMSPAPGSLPVTALPDSTRALFEAAFAPAAARGGRPTAVQWVTELGSLGQSLRPCGANAGHWFAPVAGSCPWCGMEARSGVALFPAVLVPGRAGGDGIALLWQAIQAIPDPGPMPALPPPDASGARPAARMLAAGRHMRARQATAAGIIVVGAAIVLAVFPLATSALPLLVMAALAGAAWWWQRPRELAEARAGLATVQAAWAGLQARWQPGPGAAFATTRQALAALKHEYDGLAAQRERELLSLASNRQQQQRQAHLENCEIATAKIPGIGRAKVATLLSYGIETAADIEAARIQAVPGFGAKTAAALVAFRQACEGGFRFDASRGVASATVAAMDGQLDQRRAKIVAELSAGQAKLRAMAAGEGRHRAALQGDAETLRLAYAQALVNARAVHVRI